MTDVATNMPGAGSEILSGSHSIDARDRRRSTSASRPRDPESNVANKLGAAIIAGHYKTGDYLAKELESKLDFNVSRGVYREAIRTLAAKGLVRSKTRSGTVVTEPSDWTLLDPQVLRWIRSCGSESSLAVGLRQLCESIEPVAASVAASCRDRSDTISLCEAAACLARQAVVTEASRRAEIRWHCVLLEATRNPFFISLASAMSTAVALCFPVPGEQQNTDCYGHIVDAICRRDSSAAQSATQALWERMTVRTSSG